MCVCVYYVCRSLSPSGEANDDVVHCVCGDETDEGFMIQVHNYMYTVYTMISMGQMYGHGP